MTDRTAKNIDELKGDIGKALLDMDPGLLTRSFETILNWFPLRLHISLEYYCHSIFLSILKMLRYKVRADVNEALGVVSLVLEYAAKRVYIMEIKFEATESETQKTLEGGPGAENLAKAGKTKRTKEHEESVKTTLARLLESAREQIKLNRYDARYGDELETVHRVAVDITGRTRVAVEIY
jgi:hypothetical protein